MLLCCVRSIPRGDMARYKNDALTHLDSYTCYAVLGWLGWQQYCHTCRQVLCAQLCDVCLSW